MATAATSSIGLAVNQLAAQESPASVRRVTARSAGNASHEIGTQYSEPATDRANAPLDHAWRFMRSNTLVGAEAVGFDDTHWQEVKIPHSWQTLADSTDYTHCGY